MANTPNVTGTDLPLFCVDYFTQNTDITGIGVRISFYVQSVLLGGSARPSELLMLTKGFIAQAYWLCSLRKKVPARSGPWSQ